MKLRIRDDSIRLRLTRSETGQLNSEGAVTARTSFPNGASLAYVCESVPGLASPSAVFDGGRVTVRLPASDVQAWADSGQVSITADEALAGGGSLAILVEKDFACLAPREEEDESDMFAHPLAGSESC